MNNSNENISNSNHSTQHQQRVLICGASGKLGRAILKLFSKNENFWTRSIVRPASRRLKEVQSIL